MNKKNVAKEVVTGFVLITFGTALMRGGVVRLLRQAEIVLKEAGTKLENISA